MYKSWAEEPQWDIEDHSGRKLGDDLENNSDNGGSSDNNHFDMRIAFDPFEDIWWSIYQVHIVTFTVLYSVM